jgi:dolichol kinase
MSYFYTLTTQKLIILSMLISFLATVIEAISPKGMDNLSLPVVVSVLLEVVAG